MNRRVNLRVRLACLGCYVAVCVLAWPLDLWRYFGVIAVTYILTQIIAVSSERRR